MAHDDLDRPDLDTAIDAVVSSLTAIGEDVTAASRRRTHLALHESGSTDNGWTGAWRWRIAAAGALAAAGTAGFLLWQPAQPVVSTPRPPLESRPLAMMHAGLRQSVPSRAAAAPPIDSVVAIRAGIAGPGRQPDEGQRPRVDPLVALMRAVAAIPEEAWQRGIATADGSELTIPDVPIAPLVVAPFDIPPVADAQSVPASSGEPR